MIAARTNHLRERGSHESGRVTYVELFFDLVFVFAVTQLSHGLLNHLTLGGAVETGMLMMAVWWVWIYTSWITNCSSIIFSSWFANFRSIYDRR